MELIYLWVEEYKNIKQQGFNFSPKFECEFKAEYDENLNLKDNCKLIIEKKEYKSIFPENINITAIVGENGSGKSNILEILSDYSSKDKMIIKVFYDNNRILYKINNERKINTPYIKSDIIETTILYTEIPSNNALTNKNITNISLWNNIQNNDYNIHYNLNIVKNKMQTSHIILMKKYDFLPGINKKPHYIEFSFNHYYFDNIDYNNIDLIFISTLRILVDRDNTKYKEGNDIDEYLSYGYEYLSINSIKRFIKDHITDEDTLNWLKLLNDLISQFIKYYKQILHSNNKNEFKDNKFFIKFEDFSEEFLNSIENLFSYSREELIINLKWDITLSTGEESFLNLFASLYNCIKTYSYSLEHINIIIDEIEAYLHPNWQTQFIDLIIKFFELKGMKHNSKTNIILTSHSPFILSDIPKEHLIFLEKGKQVYPFDDKKQTFGANIHTLLSHGFFMNDGLMGEFAKSKISEIKKFYELIQKLQNKGKIKKELWKKSYKRRKQRFENIQKIIGEPFLQTIIKNYLDELEILFNGKNQFLDNEIKRLQSLKDD